MKNHLFIIEDDYYKLFPMKLVIEHQMKMPLNIINIVDKSVLMEELTDVSLKNLMIKPEGGIIELVETLKKRKYNKRNSSITIFVTNEISRNFKKELSQIRKSRMAKAA